MSGRLPDLERDHAGHVMKIVVDGEQRQCVTDA